MEGAWANMESFLQPGIYYIYKHTYDIREHNIEREEIFWYVRLGGVVEDEAGKLSDAELQFLKLLWKYLKRTSPTPYPFFVK